MKSVTKFLVMVSVLLDLTATAKAGTVNVDLTGPHCTATQTDAKGTTSTSTACSTADSLPSVRYDSKDFSVFAEPNLNGGAFGASWNVCPGLSLGLQEASASAKTSDTETHTYSYGVFALLKGHNSYGALETTLTGGQTESTASSKVPSGGSLDLKYLLNVGAQDWAPFAELSGSYTDLDTGTNVWQGSAALGVRASM